MRQVIKEKGRTGKPISCRKIPLPPPLPKGENLIPPFRKRGVRGDLIPDSRMEYVAISEDVKLGQNVKLARFINLYGCTIGDNTKIGTFVEVQKNATIGKSCKISSHPFICEGVTIEDNVFIGHGVTFINDTYPRATNPDGALQTEADWKVEPILVKKGASIGSGATILSNVTIGENAIIGAGSG